jgi:hypothetical protein
LARPVLGQAVDANDAVAVGPEELPPAVGGEKQAVLDAPAERQRTIQQGDD